MRQNAAAGKLWQSSGILWRGVVELNAGYVLRVKVLQTCKSMLILGWFCNLRNNLQDGHCRSAFLNVWDCQGGYQRGYRKRQQVIPGARRHPYCGHRRAAGDGESLEQETGWGVVTDA